MIDFILDPETSSGRRPNKVLQTLCQRHAEFVSASQSFPIYAQIILSRLSEWHQKGLLAALLLYKSGLNHL